MMRLKKMQEEKGLEPIIRESPPQSPARPRDGAESQHRRNPTEYRGRTETSPRKVTYAARDIRYYNEDGSRKQPVTEGPTRGAAARSETRQDDWESRRPMHRDQDRYREPQERGQDRYRQSHDNTRSRREWSRDEPHRDRYGELRDKEDQ